MRDEHRGIQPVVVEERRKKIEPTITPFNRRRLPNMIMLWRWQIRDPDHGHRVRLVFGIDHQDTLQVLVSAGKIQHCGGTFTARVTSMDRFTYIE